LYTQLHREICSGQRPVRFYVLELVRRTQKCGWGNLVWELVSHFTWALLHGRAFLLRADDYFFNVLNFVQPQEIEWDANTVLRRLDVDIDLDLSSIPFDEWHLHDAAAVVRYSGPGEDPFERMHHVFSEWTVLPPLADWAKASSIHHPAFVYGLISKALLTPSAGVQAIIDEAKLSLPRENVLILQVRTGALDGDFMNFGGRPHADPSQDQLQPFIKCASNFAPKPSKIWLLTDDKEIVLALLSSDLADSVILTDHSGRFQSLEDIASDAETSFKPPYPFRHMVDSKFDADDAAKMVAQWFLISEPEVSNVVVTGLSSFAQSSQARKLEFGFSRNSCIAALLPLTFRQQVTSGPTGGVDNR
jgi:hypothetical protein